MPDNTKDSVPVVPVTEVVEPIKISAAEELAAIDLQIKREELALRALERQEREYSIKDLKARLGERDLKDKQAQEDREGQGRAFAQAAATDRLRWKICSHKKGGMASARDMRVLTTGGNGQYYAVVKHQMINGDVWVRCQRCSKTWSPPIKERFYFDKSGKEMPMHLGEFSQAKYEAAIIEYERAVQFETNNSMSTSVVCRFQRYDVPSGQWVDAAADYRRNVGDTNLR